MMGMILRGEAEISVAEFAMTVLRTRVVDFTVPLFDTRCAVLHFASTVMPSIFPCLQFIAFF
jgi:hypothetical protein